MKRKSLLTIIAILAALGFLVCLVLFIFIRVNRAKQIPAEETVSANIQPTATPAPTPSPAATPSATPEPTPSPTPTVDVPVDFDYWQDINEDIYAWIYFPEAGIDYPVLQNPYDDSAYLHTDVYGDYALAGSIYTQRSYNNPDFNDPVTVIYGHNMRNESMFGGLQPYMNSVDLTQEEPTITVYMPNRILTYRVAGSVPYSDSLILYYNDFSYDSVFESFFDSLYTTRSFYNSLQEDLMPQLGDRVILLSTCMNGVSDQRFLTVGVLVEEQP